MVQLLGNSEFYLSACASLTNALNPCLLWVAVAGLKGNQKLD